MPEPIAGDGHRIDRLLRAALSQPWAIEPGRGMLIAELFALRASGSRFDPNEVQSRIGAAEHRPMAAARVVGSSESGGSVAVLPVVGVISHRMGAFDDISGGVSVQGFQQQFRELVRDPSVGAIVLDIDSPGGSTDGITELGNEIHAARADKPVIAVANTLVASGAYWLASQASEISVTPSGDVGSIGVYSLHEEFSAAYAAAGIKHTLIRAGKHKVEANPWEPLSAAALAHLQQRIDEFHNEFLAAVARGRGVTAAQVVERFGDGLVFGAKEAVERGMADRVETLEQAITRAGGDLTASPGGPGGGQRSSRHAEQPAPRSNWHDRSFNYR